MQRSRRAWVLKETYLDLKGRGDHENIQTTGITDAIRL